jgi:hypothetical protein
MFPNPARGLTYKRQEGNKIQVEYSEKGHPGITANTVEAWANDDPNKAVQAASTVIVDLSTSKLIPKGNADMLIEGIGKAVNEMVGDVSKKTVNEIVPPTQQ